MSQRKNEVRKYDPNQALKSLVDAGHKDMVDKVIQHIRPLTQAGTLFAQTTHYWRSYFYRKQLAYARYICDDEAQERLLTHLLINLSLLTQNVSNEDGAARQLAEDRSFWITYLKEYVEDNALAVKNRFLANALWLALDVGHSQAQWNRFVYLLSQYCFNTSKLKTNFFYSLLLIVVDACGDKLLADRDRALDFSEVLDLDKNHIETMFEAQIILAPYVAQFRVANGEILAEIEKSFTQHNYPLNYICLLHAAVQLVPMTSPIWKDAQTVFGYVSRHIDLLYVHTGVISPVNYERMNLFITLMARTVLDLNAEPWKTRLESKNRKDLAERLFMDLLQEASKMAALYKKGDILVGDNPRLVWLRSVFQAESVDGALFHFVPRVCARLKRDAARREAVDLLMSYERRKQTGIRHQNITINLIKTLILTQKMNDEKRKAAALCFEMVRCAVYSDMNSLFPVFDFLGDECRILELAAPHKRGAILADVCQSLKESKHIQECLAKYKEELDAQAFVLSDEAYRDEVYNVARAYTVLLCKHGSDQDVAQWNYQLVSNLNSNPNPNPNPTSQGWGGWALVKIMLPRLALDDRKKWMDFMLRPRHFNAGHARAKIILECVTIGMASLPVEEKEKYSEQVDRVLSVIIFHFKSSIELMVNLFQALHDNHNPQAALQRESFLNKNSIQQGLYQ